VAVDDPHHVSRRTSGPGLSPKRRILLLTASNGYLVPTSGASSDFLKDEYTLFDLIVSIAFRSVGNVNIYITDYTPLI